MAGKYQQLVGKYCAVHGISIPPGFGRHSGGRYAVIRTHLSPPKLIAATWFKTADVHYYITHFLLPELGDSLARSIRILDFKEGAELAYTGGKRLARVGTFSVGDSPQQCP